MDIPADVPTDVLAALAQVRVDEATPSDAVLRVAAAARAAAGADAAATRLLLASGPAVAAATDPRAGRIDDLQQELGQGPVVQALQHLSPVVVDSLPGDPRWPDVAAAAAAAGVCAVMALPLRAHDRPVGSITVCSTLPARFDEGSVARMGAFAGHAGVVLANLQVYWEARHLADNLQQALDSRATIDHAIGILMAGGSPSPSEAFQLLVKASQRENRKLRDIAADIVARATERSRRRADT